MWKIALILWENRSTTTRCAIAEPISELYLRGSGDADHHTRHFWCFWLTIQNITNRHVSNAFDLLAVFISFSLACFPGGYPTDFHCASSVGYHVAPSSISCARSLFWEGCCSAAVPKNKTSSGVDYPGNPHGNGVWPCQVLHGDHQLMWPARFAAPPIVCRK